MEGKIKSFKDLRIWQKGIEIVTGSLKHKLFFRVKLAGIIALDERKSNELINDIESDPLFKSLMKSGVVKYRRHSNWNLASDFLEFDDNIFHNTSADSDISEVVENNSDILPIIKNLGIDKFKSLFLNSSYLDENKIASDIGADILTVQRIIKLINEVSVLSEFFHPSKISQPSISYVKIAKIDVDDGQLVCGYYSLNMAKGKYLIDNEKLELFKTELDGNDKIKLKELLSAINLMNSKKSIVHDIISMLMKLQNQYFLTGSLSKLNVLTAKDLSQQLKISQSSVSRAIFKKSIVTPWDIEITIKSLLPHKKNVVKHVLKDILNKHPGYIDEQIREELSNKHNISVSRRLVCLCRNEENIKTVSRDS